LVCESNNACGDGVEGDDDDGCAGDKLIAYDPAQGLDFGNVSVGNVEELTLKITNIGTCPLTVFQVNLDTPITPEFVCEGCQQDSPNKYPVELAPNGVPFEVVALYAPVDAEPDSGFIEILSDDPENPKVKIPLVSSSKGIASLEVSPTSLEFGFVAVGDKQTLTFTICNGATDGTAGLEIRNLKEEGTASTQFEAIPVDALPVTLPPTECLDVDATYTPLELADSHTMQVLIESNDGEKPDFPVTLAGFSMTAPRANIDPLVLQFPPTPVATESLAQFVITNLGEDDLELSGALNSLSDPDFSFEPTVLPMLGGGGATAVTVKFNPVTPGMKQGIIEIQTNDPNNPNVEVRLEGEGLEENFNDVIKIEMTFDNGSDSWADEDFRDVDLIYENTAGMPCSKAFPAPDWTHVGVNNWGKPHWFRIGAKEDPERVSHVDPRIDNGCFHVAATYVQDCSSIAKGLVAQLLNTTVDSLIAGLTEGLINLDVDLSDVCFSFDSSNVTVTAFVNGTVIAENTINLGKRGDFAYVMTVKRENGKFTAEGYNPGCQAAPNQP
jgi:hypothetical protein